MRKNRRVKKNSRANNTVCGIASLTLMAVVAVITYGLLKNQCVELRKEIGRAEKLYDALEKERTGEMLRWEEMQQPEKLQERLVRFGLEMRLPRPTQIVRMTVEGRPAPGQIAVARAQARMQTGMTAQAAGAAAGGKRRRAAR